MQVSITPASSWCSLSEPLSLLGILLMTPAQQAVIVQAAGVTAALWHTDSASCKPKAVQLPTWLSSTCSWMHRHAKLVCMSFDLVLNASQVHHALAEMLTSILQPNLKTDQPRSLARSLSPHILQVGNCIPLHMLTSMQEK